uniref:Ankyrin repeat protein RF_0381 n=1 Tax=Culex pipiens TaxID=7175 RepID=A0A8D8CBZ3_CULPI
MEDFNFGLFDDLLEGEPHPLEIEEFEDEQDYKRKLKEKKLNIYEPTCGEARLHRAIRSGKQIEINALLELYQEDFDRVRDHLVAKYQWDVEDKVWLRKTILVASTEEQCQSAKNLENRQVDAEAMRRAVLVLLQNPVNGEEVAVLYPNEANRSAVTKLITTLTPNGFLSWNFVSTIGAQETFMQVAASKGSKRVIDRLYELGAPIAIPGHNPLMQAIRNNRKEMVSWLLTEHFDHFDCTMRNSDQHNALIAAIIKNVTGLFDLVLEKMMDYRRKYYSETEEETFHEIFRLENEENEYTSIFEYLRKAGPITERVERAIQQYKLKLSHRWKNYVVLGRLIDRSVALDYCFEGIRNDPQLLGLTEYETITILHQLVAEGHYDFVREMYTKHPDVKTYFNTDQAFEVLRKAIHDESRETIRFVLEHHGEFLKCDLDKLRDDVVCSRYYTKEFYEPRRDLLLECFPEFRENVLFSMETASSSVCYNSITDFDKLYSTFRGSNGETVLHLAVERDDKELFVRMLEGGCELDELDNDGNHAVHMVKSEEMLDLIIDRHPDGRHIVHRSNNDGFTVLHKVCQQYVDISTQVALLEKVIAYGADVHQLNNHGESAVFFVSNSHQLDVLRKHGAQLDVVNQAGGTALQRHLVNYNVCVANSLLAHFHDQPSFKQHAHQYLAPMMRYNRDFFSCDYQKFLEAHPESARAMFDSVYEYSREEASRLFAKACSCAFIYISEMFLSGDYDLDYSYKFEYGNTPLIGLLSYMELSNLHVVKQLLEKKGVDLLEKNEFGRDALLTLVRGFRSARWHGHGLGTVQLLLDYGASVHTTDKDGSTALHFAFANGEMELVELLVRNGADLGAFDNRGKRPIERASNVDQELFYFYS